MNENWRQKRKTTILSIFLLLSFFYFGYKLYPVIFKAPSCDDKKLNGDETNVDCGGSCKKICLNNVVLPEIKFVKYIETEENLYDLVVFIENKNTDKQSEDTFLNYEVNGYDNFGKNILNFFGSSSIPLGRKFPIIIQNVPIQVDGAENKISKINFRFLNDKNWIKADPVFNNIFFKVLDNQYIKEENYYSKLKVKLKNLVNAELRDVPVRALLYDEDDNLIAANETILEKIKKDKEEEIFFLWRNILKTTNPKVEIYPIVTPSVFIVN